MGILKKIETTAFQGLKGIVRAPAKAYNKVMDKFEGKLKEMDHTQMKRNLKLIDENFDGGVPGYLKHVENNPLPMQKPKRLLK